MLSDGYLEQVTRDNFSLAICCPRGEQFPQGVGTGRTAVEMRNGGEGGGAEATPPSLSSAQAVPGAARGAFAGPMHPAITAKACGSAGRPGLRLSAGPGAAAGPAAPFPPGGRPGRAGPPEASGPRGTGLCGPTPTPGGRGAHGGRGTGKGPAGAGSPGGPGPGATWGRPGTAASAVASAAAARAPGASGARPPPVCRAGLGQR